MKKLLLFIALPLIAGTMYAQPGSSSSWRDFAQKRTSGDLGTTTLTDFSYAGYKFSNEALPDTSGWNVVRVRDHGARPDDSQSDNAGIQRAINAAQNSNRPSIVQFESGRYIINKRGSGVETIVISKSNIVLRGKGSGSSGTIIFCEEEFLPPRANGTTPLGDWAFYFRSTGSSSKITDISREVKRGAFEITVASSSGLSVGQTILVRQQNKNNRAPNGVSYRSTSLTEQWTRTNTKGLVVREVHVIKSINGNRLRLENPILMNLPDVSNTDIATLQTLENIGVESMRFTGNWTSYGETFIHHKPGDFTHDQGWSGLLFEKVSNSWITDCEFRDWNEAVEFDQAAAMTISNCKFTGKRAHASFAAKQSTGLLFKNIEDRQNSIHGPGWQISSCGIVCTNYDLTKDQGIDLHGANPYANLFDRVDGVFDQNGSSLSNYPNAGPYNTFWNFVHDSNDGAKTLDFWDLSSRKLWTFANPIFVGLTSTGNKVTLRNAGKNESQGSRVYPPSLFDAQLQLRKFGGVMTASNTKSGRSAVRANDGKSSTAWETNNRVANQWLMLDYGTPKTIDKIFVDEASSTIGNYKIQYWKDNRWNNLRSGSGIGSNKTITFASTRLTVIRLLVESKKSGASGANIKINTFGQNPGSSGNPPANSGLEGTYLFKNKASGNYMDSDGTTVSVKSRTGNADQQWALVNSAGSNYNIDNRHSDRGVLDADDGKVVKGSNIAPPSTANDKEWTIESLGSNTYRFKNVQHGGFLAENTSSNTIEHTSWNGSRSQWTLERVTTANRLTARIETDAPKMVVYPNPVHDGTFTVDLNGINSSQVSVYNITGALVYSGPVEKGSIQISTEKGFTTGVYLIETNDENGQVYKQKLIVE